MEDGKGEEIPSAVAVLGFTTILVVFSVIGVWARLAYGRDVLDGPFNPTYRLSLKSYTDLKTKCYQQFSF